MRKIIEAGTSKQDNDIKKLSSKIKTLKGVVSELNDSLNKKVLNIEKDIEFGDVKDPKGIIGKLDDIQSELDGVFGLVKRL